MSRVRSLSHITAVVSSFENSAETRMIRTSCANRVSSGSSQSRNSRSEDRARSEFEYRHVRSRVLPHLFQPRERPTTAPKAVHLQAKALEHRHIQVAERRAVLGVEGEVLAVPEAAAGQEHRQVLARVVAG